jgi:hypothetical protein
MAGGRAPDCDAVGCFDFGDDWTFAQDILDEFTAAGSGSRANTARFRAFGTIGNSDYHGAP